MSKTLRNALVLIAFAAIFIVPKFSHNIQDISGKAKKEVEFDWAKFKDSCVPLDQLPTGQQIPEGTKICIPKEVVEKLRRQEQSETD